MPNLPKRSLSNFLLLLVALLVSASGLGADPTPETAAFPEQFAIYRWKSAEGGIYEGPACRPNSAISEDGNYTCKTCAGVWHLYGSNGAENSISVTFKCDNPQSKADAINEILSYFTSDPICSGSCAAAEETCEPTGLISSTSDGVELEVDNDAPFCGYTAKWKANASADFTPSDCKCI